jgi:AcrR family transcriptional regulator
MSIVKLGTEIRREQIAQAALHIIAANGMRKLNMAGLARRVGMVPSGIYRHYRNKDELLDAVLEFLRHRLLGNVAAVQAQIDDPLEQLQELLDLHVRLILEHQALPRILFSEEVYGDHQERKGKLRDAIHAYLSEVADIVRNGQVKRQIKPELNPDTVALMFLGLVQPTAILWHLSDGEFDAAKHVERAWPIFREAIRVNL